MGIRRRLRLALAWGLFLILATLAGGGLCAYFYVLDSDNLVALVKGEAPRFLPDGKVDLSRIRVRPLLGEITLSHVSVKRNTGGANPTLVAMSPWVQVRYDAWAALTDGKFIAQRVVVAQPLLRLRPMPDGSWNVQGLLADPLPIPMTGSTPPIEITNGMVEVASGPDESPGTAVLRDASIRLPAGTGGPIAFEMTARGDLLDRVVVEGTFDPSTGRLALTRGDLTRLSLGEVMRERLPAKARAMLGEAGLEGGELDVSLARLGYDPNASPKLTYDAAARLRHGTWKCPKLPFPIADVSVDLSLRDGAVHVDRAEGKDGATTIALSGRFGLGDPANGPCDVHAEARNLELDGRLRRWTPAKYAPLWDVYFPRVGRDPSASAGKVDVVVDASRAGPDAEVRARVDVACQDVSMEYLHFRYPVDHVRGSMRLDGKRMTLDLSAPVGGSPLRVRGTIDDPGPDAVANLQFDADSVPIDAALLKALPPDVRKVINEFHPAGSARGHATVTRHPPKTPQDDPIGRVAFDADIRLNNGCSVTWDGFKYPVTNLTGRLEVHPNHWVFSEMRGDHGPARIEARGEVDQLGRDKFKVRTRVQARNLTFDQQLHDALPAPLQVTWKTLNPTGSSDIDAEIESQPGRHDHHVVKITPRPGAGVKLKFDRPGSAPGEPPTPIELKMDEVKGQFVLDTAKNPPTEMKDVEFVFQGAPVRFGLGMVAVEDTGKFELGVTNLVVGDLRLDERLCRQMPPIMAQMARRLDDRKIRLLKGDLGLGWSGKPGESAWCHWDKTLVVLDDNKVDLGSELALDHIHGQIEGVEGYATGDRVEVHGLLNLDSVKLLGQQITRLKSRFDVNEKLARFPDLSGRLLEGSFSGSIQSTLETTPRYEAGLKFQDADLRAYAATVPGHQAFQGRINGWASVKGAGADLHSLQAAGAARVDHAGLGTVPPLLVPIFKFLPGTGDPHTAFDAAEVSFKTRNGATRFDPVRIVGNAVTLHGDGNLDIEGNLNLKLAITTGRDKMRGSIWEMTRKLGGQLFAIRVQGPLSSPTFSAEPFPIAGEAGRMIGGKDNPDRPGPTRR